MLAFNKPQEPYEKFLVIKNSRKSHHLISKTFLGFVTFIDNFSSQEMHF